jgi:hypothetical protein
LNCARKNPDAFIFDTELATDSMASEKIDNSTRLDATHHPVTFLRN